MRDSAGAPVADAQVAVREVATGRTRGALTDARGAVTLAGLPAGRYAVRAQRAGYRPATEAEVVLADGEARTLAVRLAPAPATLGAVTVTAARR